MGMWEKFKSLFPGGRPTGNLSESSEGRKWASRKLEAAAQDLRKALGMRRKEAAFYKEFGDDLKTWSKEIDETFDRLEESDRKLAKLQVELREDIERERQRKEQARQQKEQARQQKERYGSLMIRYRSYEARKKALSANDPDYKTKSESLAKELSDIETELKRLESELNHS